MSALNQASVLRMTVAATLRNEIASPMSLNVSRNNPQWGQLQSEINQLSEAKAALTVPTATTAAMVKLRDDVDELQMRLDDLISAASEDPPDDPVGLAGAGAGDSSGGDGGVSHRCSA